MGRKYTSIYFLIGVFIILRFLFLGHTPDSWDTVDFALGIERYDIFQMQPHFPGYPIYMLFAKWINMVVNEPIISLSITSAISNILTVLFIYLTVRNLFNKTISFYVALLTIVNPALWLIGDQPMSDSMGIMMVWLVLWIISKTIGSETNYHFKIGIITSFIFGLSMGVRISYFPFAFILLNPLVLSTKGSKIGQLLKNSLYMGLSFSFGILVWLLPVAYTEGGVSRYFQLGLAFTSGHFNDWGGTLFSEEGSILSRFFQFLSLILVSIGGYGSGETESLFIRWTINAWLVIGIIIVLFYRRELIRRLKVNFNWITFSVLALSTIPYIIWVLVGQNIDKPRHVAVLLPFIFMMFAYIGQFVGKWWKGWMIGLSLLTFSISLPMMINYVTSPPPMVQLANNINTNYQIENTTIITWEEERVVDYLYPGYHTIRLRKPDDFENTVLLYGEGRTILVTNAVLNGFGSKSKEYINFFNSVFEVKSDSFLYPTYNHIILYKAKPSFYRWLQIKKE